MAPVSTVMNGPPLRGECAWMAAATALLPVPVSPVMSTFASLSASASMSETMRNIEGACAINPETGARCADSASSEARTTTMKRARGCRQWAVSNATGATETLTSWAPVSGHLMKARRPSTRLPALSARCTSSPVWNRRVPSNAPTGLPMMRWAVPLHTRWSSCGLARTT